MDEIIVSKVVLRKPKNLIEQLACYIGNDKYHQDVTEAASDSELNGFADKYLGKKIIIVARVEE